MIKKTLIACSTPYTVLNAVNYRFGLPSEELVDIIIFTFTPSVKKLVNLLKREKVFEIVYEAHDIRQTKLMPLLLFMSYLFPRMVLKILKINSYPIDYDVIISQNYLFITLMRGLNLRAEYFLIEEGLTSYTGRILKPKGHNSKIKQLYRNIFRDKIDPQVKGKYLYSPEMIIESPHPKIFRLPGFKMNKSTIYNNLFGYKENYLYKEKKVIFTGAPDMIWRKCAVDYNVMNEYEFFSKHVLCHFNPDDVIFRPHPAEKEYERYLDIALDKYNNQWELECFYNLTDEHIIINFFSTTAVTPKLLFDKEPVVIFLYKLSNYGKELVDKYDEFINELKNMYRNKSRVIVINDLRELNCLKTKFLLHI